jgi:hypothetical protein
MLRLAAKAPTRERADAAAMSLDITIMYNALNLVARGVVAGDAVRVRREQHLPPPAARAGLITRTSRTGLITRTARAGLITAPLAQASSPAPLAQWSAVDGTGCARCGRRSRA